MSLPVICNLEKGDQQASHEYLYVQKQQAKIQTVTLGYSSLSWSQELKEPVPISISN